MRSDERTAVRDVAERVVFLLAVTALCALALAALNGLGRQAVEGRLSESLEAMAGTYVSSAEASLDYGLPVNGPGSVEAVLQPPAMLADGDHGLSLKLERHSRNDAISPPIPGRVRYNPQTVIITERPVLDSHGEVSARLILSRSTVGLHDDFRKREQLLAWGMAGLAAVMAVLLIFLPPRRVLLVPAVLFPVAASLLLASFGSQLVSISRQAAQLAVADTSGDLVKADQLGISFDQLVGMQDYLRQQVGSNPAIGRIELTGLSGVAYAATGDDLGTAVTDLLAASPLSFLVSDLVVEQSLQTGVKLSATVNIQPIMRDLAAPLLVVLVLWIGCGAALWVSFVDRIGQGASLPFPIIPPALFFFLLFLVFGAQLSTSALDQHWQAWLLVAGMGCGFLLPPRFALPAYVTALALAALGLVGDSGWLLAGAGLGCGVGLANVRTILKPFHLAASLVPSIGLLCAGLFDLLPGVLPGKIAVAILLLLVAPMFIRRGTEVFVVAREDNAGSLAGLVAGFWIWFCLFVMQFAGHLLLIIAALGVNSALPGHYGQIEYLLLMVLLFLVGNQLAGWFGHASRLRWISCELAMLGVVLLTVWSYIAGGNLFVNTAIMSVLFGAVVRGTTTLPFVVTPDRISGSLISGVALFAFAAALAAALSLTVPASAALPAILLFLAAFSPLAFAAIAGIGPQIGNIFSRNGAQ